MADEITEALVELRDIANHGAETFIFDTNGIVTIQDAEGCVLYRFDVKSEALTEAMQAVRKWKESQQ